MISVALVSSVFMKAVAKIFPDRAVISVLSALKIETVVLKSVVSFCPEA